MLLEVPSYKQSGVEAKRALEEHEVVGHQIVDPVCESKIALVFVESSFVEEVAGIRKLKAGLQKLGHQIPD
ncbi:hypothetical protein Tco_0256779 [Tanacetum coccineum]